MRDEFFLGSLIKELHGFPGELLMLLEVVVGTAGDSPEFLFPVGEMEHEVGGGL